MKYLCLGYYEPERAGAVAPETYEAIVARCRDHDEELKATGCVHSVASLAEGEVMTICTRGDKTVTTDGPWIESKEQVGSFFIVDARDFNDAARIAAKHPAAVLGEELGWAVEIRPIEHYQGG